MSRKNQMSFMFQQASDSDHPDAPLETHVSDQRTRNVRPERLKYKADRPEPRQYANKDGPNGHRRGGHPSFSSSQPSDSWDDPHQVLQRSSRTAHNGMPSGARTKRRMSSTGSSSSTGSEKGRGMDRSGGHSTGKSTGRFVSAEPVSSYGQPNHRYGRDNEHDNYEGNRGSYRFYRHDEDADITRSNTEGRTSPSLPFHRKRKKRPHDIMRKKPQPRRSQKNSRFWERLLGRKQVKMAVTAGTAIMVGLLLGVMVLSVFSNLSDGDAPASGEMNGNPANGAYPQGGGDQTGQNGQGSGDGHDSSANGLDAGEGDEVLIPSGSAENGVVHLPARQHYVAQVGAFAEREPAEASAAKLEENGLSGLLMRVEDTYRLYAGVSVRQEDIVQVADFIQSKGLDTYVTEHEVPAASQVQVDNVDADALHLLPSFVDTGEHIVAYIGHVTADGLTQSEGLSDEVWSELQDLHQSFLEDGTSLFEQWQGEEKEIGQQMLRELSIGINALENYKEQPNSAYLWQAQQANLNYVQLYERFVSAINDQNRQ